MVWAVPLMDTPVKFRKPLVEVPPESRLGESAPFCEVAVRVAVAAESTPSGKPNEAAPLPAKVLRRNCVPLPETISTLPVPSSMACRFAARNTALLWKAVFKLLSELASPAPVSMAPRLITWLPTAIWKFCVAGGLLTATRRCWYS